MQRTRNGGTGQEVLDGFSSHWQDERKTGRGEDQGTTLAGMKAPRGQHRD